MTARAPMLEIRRTTEVPIEPEGLQDLLDNGRLGSTSGDDWPEERHLLGECVMLAGPRAVGFGRVIWDAHTDDLPRVIDMALATPYQGAFFVDTLEHELIAEYAEEAEGGHILRGHDGRLIDVTRALAGPGTSTGAQGLRRPRA